MKLLSCVLLFATLWTVAHQAPPSMGFFRQEYWSGLPFPSPELAIKRASLVAQLVKNLPAMWETQVRSLYWEDLLEKKMSAHSSILAWRIPWTDREIAKSRT